MTSLGLLTCLVLITCSAYLSAAEIAVFSLSRFQIRSIKENFRPAHRKLKKLLNDPSGLLITILMINEILNISISTIITESVSHHSSELPLFLSSIPRWLIDTLIGILLTTPIILFLCDITPKVVGARLNQFLSIMTIGPLYFLYDVLKPLRSILKGVVELIASVLVKMSRKQTKSTSADHHEHERVLKESEFLLMLEEGHREGSIELSELALIKNVFDLDNTSVEEVATPISQVRTIFSHMTLKDALQEMRTQKYSRIPVMSPDRRDIIGILYTKDLLRMKFEPELSVQTVASVMRKPFFVRPTLKMNSLFRKFKFQKIHMAIVKDSDGPIIGVITMNDILDTLFEDILAEKPHYSPMNKNHTPINPGTKKPL